MNIGPVSTTTAGGPVPTSQEAQLLTGNCTIPYIATVSTLQNSILNIPWIGCSNQHLDCCPWHMDSQVPLTACPQDYATTSGTCCPTSWSVYSSAIAGQTPCFTTTSAMLVLPSLSPANSEISSNRVFTSGFILESPSTGLSKKAKIGISSGIGFGVLLVLAIVAFTKYRQHKAKEVRLATVYRSQSYVTQDQSPTALQSGVQFSPTLMRHNTVHNKHLSRLATDCPSPLSQRSGNDSPIITPPPVPPKAPMELPGDTILNAHHPAMKSTPHGIELE